MIKFEDIPIGTRLIWQRDRDFRDYERVRDGFIIVRSGIPMDHDYASNKLVGLFNPSDDGRWLFVSPKERAFDKLYLRLK